MSVAQPLPIGFFFCFLETSAIMASPRLLALLSLLVLLSACWFCWWQIGKKRLKKYVLGHLVLLLNSVYRVLYKEGMT